MDQTGNPVLRSGKVAVNEYLPASTMKILTVCGGAFVLAVAVGLCGRGELYPGFHHPSPDGTHTASFYGWGSGGAAGSLFEYVSIRRAGSNLESGTIVLEMNYGYDVCLFWPDAGHLVVKLPSNAGVVKQRTVVDLDRTIRVSFELEPSSDGEFASDNCRGRIGRIRGVDEPWEQ